MLKWKTSEYRSWQAMKQRCHNPNYPNYKLYGGKEIFVCDEWRILYEDENPKNIKHSKKLLQLWKEQQPEIIYYEKYTFITNR